MSFIIPAQGTYAREQMGDLAHVAEILDPRNLAKLPDLLGAINMAKRTLRATPEARRVSVVCIRFNGDRELIEVGRRGAWRTLHVFGQ